MYFMISRVNREDQADIKEIIQNSDNYATFSFRIL